jgi:hypothetical protein
MEPANKHPLDSIQLPFDLAALTAFTLQDVFVQTLVNSASNRFFSAGANGRIGIRGEGGCWELLPVEWRAYSEKLESGTAREDLLMQLARGESKVRSGCGARRAREQRS